VRKPQMRGNCQYVLSCSVTPTTLSLFPASFFLSLSAAQSLLFNRKDEKKLKLVTRRKKKKRKKMHLRRERGWMEVDARRPRLPGDAKQ
jgi:hypothetical protein